MAMEEMALMGEKGVDFCQGDFVDECVVDFGQGWRGLEGKVVVSLECKWEGEILQKQKGDKFL